MKNKTNLIEFKTVEKIAQCCYLVMKRIKNKKKIHENFSGICTVLQKRNIIDLFLLHY